MNSLLRNGVGYDMSLALSLVIMNQSYEVNIHRLHRSQIINSTVVLSRVFSFNQGTETPWFAAELKSRLKRHEVAL